MTNRRRHRRVPLAAIGVIKITGETEAGPLRTLIADISLSGIGVYSQTAIKDGADLTVELQFVSPNGHSRTAPMRGTSVYSRDLEGAFFVGIQFAEEIGPENEPSLHEHLQRILNAE